MNSSIFWKFDDSKNPKNILIVKTQELNFKKSNNYILLDKIYLHPMHHRIGRFRKYKILKKKSNHISVNEMNEKTGEFSSQELSTLLPKLRK